jgi:hypothetical protein
MPVWAAWAPRIFIPSSERSVMVPLPAKLCPRYSTTHGRVGRFLGLEVPRLDRDASVSDGSFAQGEYMQSCVVGKRIWILIREREWAPATSMEIVASLTASA